MNIADIFTNGGVPFSSRCTISKENAKCWPVWAILAQIYALLGVIFAGPKIAMVYQK